MDEDVIGLEREISGEEIVVCDFCGQAVPRSSVVRAGGVSGLAEPVEALHACADCRIRIEQEEMPFDEEIAAGLRSAQE